jgi:hypothetical protein
MRMVMCWWLGVALTTQGVRSRDSAGSQLLEEAVKVHQRALKLRPREYLPQPWAETQHYLGVALAAQGKLMGSAAGKLRLEKAVAAYTRALEVRTHEHFPGLWAQTHEQLAEVYAALNDEANTAQSAANFRRIFPGVR